MARKNVVDAEKLFETLIVISEITTCSQTTCAFDPGACHLRCALGVVDELLSTPGAVDGEETDQLLDFRSLLRARRDAEATLRLFCELRRRLEQRQYLAFFRLRRWLENQITATIQPRDGGEKIRIAPRLNFFCVEAIRRLTLCSAIQSGFSLVAPQLEFYFVPTVHRQAEFPSIGRAHELALN